MVLKEITKNRDIADEWHLVARFGDFRLEQSPMASVSPLRIKTLDSNVRVSMIGLLTVAPANTKVESPTLLLISGFTLQGNKVVLINAGVT